MTFLGCFRFKPKKPKVRAMTAPAAAAGRTEEDWGEESISNVPETVVLETGAPERPSVDKGKGIATGDDGSKTVTTSDADHEAIKWSEVLCDSDGSGPSCYYPGPSRRPRSPPTRLPPCPETASDDCHPPPPSSPPSPNNLADDYQLRSYYPTENHHPQPVYRVPLADLYPQDEPPAYYQTYPPCHHQEQQQQPDMSDTEKLAHRIANSIFGPVNPYQPSCCQPRPY